MGVNPRVQRGVDGQADTSSFSCLPLNLQCIILAASGAPLNTCKAASLISQDSELTAQWLLITCSKPLLKAAKHRLWDTCSHLLGAEVCHTSADIHFAAYFAAGAGETATLARLLEVAQPARGSVHAGALRKAYLEAASSGQAGICKLLQQYDPRLAPRDLKEGGPLSTAVIRGHAEVVSTMLDACKASLKPGAYQSLQQDVLKAACRHNQAAVAAAVLSGGADVNSNFSAFDKEYAPLAIALHSQAWEVVRVLLTHGAHVHAPYGNTPSALGYAAHQLGYRIRSVQHMACKVLLESDRVRVGGSELAAAVDSGELPVLTLLLGGVANMDTLVRQDDKHRAGCLGMALAAAVGARKPDMVNALLTPPPHWGPVTSLVIQPALAKAAEGLGKGKGLERYRTLQPVSTCCLTAPCHDVLL
jgi:ankyrin repeat protein